MSLKYRLIVAVSFVLVAAIAPLFLSDSSYQSAAALEVGANDASSHRFLMIFAPKDAVLVERGAPLLLDTRTGAFWSLAIDGKKLAWKEAAKPIP